MLNMGKSNSLGEFRIDDFKIDKNYIYNLLSEKNSQNSLLNGDYSAIFNGFDSLRNLELKNFKTNFEDDMYEDDTLVHLILPN